MMKLHWIVAPEGEGPLWNSTANEPQTFPTRGRADEAAKSAADERPGTEIGIYQLVAVANAPAQPAELTTIG